MISYSRKIVTSITDSEMEAVINSSNLPSILEEWQRLLTEKISSAFGLPSMQPQTEPRPLTIDKFSEAEGYMTFGLRCRTDTKLTVTREDWSKVRSPSRAKRRRKRGHRQNIEIVTYPDPNIYRAFKCLYAHPTTLRNAIASANAGEGVSCVTLGLSGGATIDLRGAA